MENENKSKSGCGCGSTDCCTPKKSSSWMKFIFIAIVAEAITIVVIKFLS